MSNDEWRVRVFAHLCDVARIHGPAVLDAHTPQFAAALRALPDVTDVETLRVFRARLYEALEAFDASPERAATRDHTLGGGWVRSQCDGIEALHAEIRWTMLEGAISKPLILAIEACDPRPRERFAFCREWRTGPGVVSL